MSTPNDTQKSATQLLSDCLPALKGAGLLYGQQVRDLITSLIPPYSGLSFTVAAETSISEAGTYVKAAGTTAVTNTSSDMTASTSNRLTYTGATARHFHIVCQASVTIASGTNQNIGIQVYHYDASAASGALLAHSDATTTIPNTAQVQITSHADVMLDTNDYVELYIGNNTGTINVTVELGYLFAVGMLM